MARTISEQNAGVESSKYVSLFFVYKPIGASPGRDYELLLKRMVRTTISLVLYNIVRYVTSKKGGNAPRGLRIKRSV